MLPDAHNKGKCHRQSDFIDKGIKSREVKKLGQCHLPALK